MITVPPFDPAQAKSLQSFLDAPERSADSMGYAQAAGFLFSVACAPELVKPADWMPKIIDPDNAVETSLEEKKAITAGLMSLYNEMTHQVQKVNVKLPHDIGFLEEPMANLESNASISRWAQGFRSGYFWLESSWSAYIPEEIKEESGYHLTVLCFFSNRKMATSLYEGVKNPDITLESMAASMKKIFPDAMRGFALLGNSIHQALATRDGATRLPVNKAGKVGRNEPCPCGSGRKFKKCCGTV